MDSKQLLNNLLDQKNLSSKEVEFLLEEIIAGRLTSAQIAAFLVGLRTKGETIDEILGLIHGMRKHMIRVGHPEQREGSLANASSNTLRDSSATPQNDNNDDHLELVALATIADLVPLVGANRTLTKFGLKKLQTTRRVGLLALYNEAGIDRSVLGTYEVGH